MSGVNDLNFDAISDIASRLTIKKSTLADRDKKVKKDVEKAKEKIDITTFVELPDPFEQETVDELRTYTIRSLFRGLSFSMRNGGRYVLRSFP